MAHDLGIAGCARHRLADADLEMKQVSSFVDDLPAGDAIIALEETEHGWRGLTAKGELLDVRSRNGHKAAVPDGDDVLMVHGKVPISRTAIKRAPIRIDDYLDHYDSAAAFTRENRNAEALANIEFAMTLAPTLFARFNRALILLALGRWREGFAEYRDCEKQAPLTRPAVIEALAAGGKLWDGEDLAGKRLLLLHAHGFGDTIMMLRYVPLLKAIGADVVLKVPDELRSLAAQCAPVTDKLEADFVCPILHVADMLSVTPANVGNVEPYLRVEPAAVAAWRSRLGPGRHVGIAWSTSAQRPGDYPRTVPIERLVAAIGGDANLHSVQKQGGLEALKLGVRVHPFGDFADCAALMLAMDRIISVDTAAVHLAGAIGHPRVELLLGHWASWRWLAPWYPNVKLRRQTASDDWDSALAQLDPI
jgi:hypothetical protein